MPKDERCPVCKATNIRVIDVSTKIGKDVARRVRCDTCGSKWTELWVFKGYSEITEGNKKDVMGEYLFRYYHTDYVLDFLARAKEALIDAEKVFREEPSARKCNHYGLCYFFKHKYNFTSEQVDAILNKQNSGAGFMFESRTSQESVYKCGLKKEELEFERADFCKFRLKAIDKYISLYTIVKK